MDLKRLRTFVAVAELGTVSRAALDLRISQSALSRQIGELEQEFGFRLFDRLGRRLMLTAIGEQVLGECRGLLGQVASLGERMELLRRGDGGVLKVAAPPQTIESVLSTFLPRYAGRFPKVQVKLTEALGPEQSAMLERGEVHVGIRHDQYASRFLASRPLPPDEVLAACAPSRRLGHAGMIDIGNLAAYPLLLLELGLFSTQNVQCSLPSRRRRAERSAREPCAAHRACARRGRARNSDHSVAAANGSLRPEDRSCHARAQTASGGVGHPVGQAASNAALCRELLRGARQVYGRHPPDHAAVRKQEGQCAQASCHPKTAPAFRPKLKMVCLGSLADLAPSLRLGPLHPSKRTCGSRPLVEMLSRGCFASAMRSPKHRGSAAAAPRSIVSPLQDYAGIGAATGCSITLGWQWLETSR